MADTISNLLSIAERLQRGKRAHDRERGEDSPIETLPPQCDGFAGVLHAASTWIKQIANLQNGEYVITIAAKDDGGYQQAAEPIITVERNDPPGTRSRRRIHMDRGRKFRARSRVGQRRRARHRGIIELISRLADLRSPLQADECCAFCSLSPSSGQGQAGGKVVYVGLHGKTRSLLIAIR